MDVGKAIGFVFEDEGWVPKVLIGGLLSLVPIVDLAVIGYAVRTAQNVAAGRERPLPEWSDLGDYFVKGLLYFVASLIYAAPIVVAVAASAIMAQLGDAGHAAELTDALTASLACLVGLYGLLLGFWLPAATINFAASGELAAFFRVREIWGLVSLNLGDYIIALIVYVVAGFVAGILGLLLCLVGVLFTGFVTYLIAAHLGGQILRQSGRPVATPAA